MICKDGWLCLACLSWVSDVSLHHWHLLLYLLLLYYGINRSPEFSYAHDMTGQFEGYGLATAQLCFLVSVAVGRKLPLVSQIHEAPE